MQVFWKYLKIEVFRMHRNN